jgi:biotin carboxylase
VRAALRASRIGLCLVEELAEQPVVTVSAFSHEGTFHPLVVTDRVPLAHVWESGHADTAVALAGRAAEALGIRKGPSITQIGIGPDGPLVLELAARIGGGHEAELCEAALGIDLHALAIGAALGKEPAAKRLRPSRRAGGACVRFLSGDGEAEGLARAEAIPGVAWARVYGGSERAGAVLAVGASRDEALAQATRAAECIRFRAVDAHAV